LYEVDAAVPRRVDEYAIFVSKAGAF